MLEKRYRGADQSLRSLINLRPDAFSPSGPLQKTRLQHEGPLVSLAVHLMVAGALGQANAFDLGAFLQHDGRALDLQVLDQDNGVAVGQRVAVGVPDDAVAGFLAFFGGCGHRPFVSAVGADVVVAVGVGVIHAANRAGWDINCCHRDILVFVDGGLEKRTASLI